MHTVNNEFIYSLFQDHYYSRQFTVYSDTEIRVYEAVQCLRKSYLTRRKKFMMSPNKIVIVDFGNIVHNALENQLLKHGYSIEKEKRYTFKDMELIGHPDALHDTYSLELKTCSKLPHQALIHHVLQDNAYNFIADKEIGYIAYIQKTIGFVKTFPIKRDKNYFLHILLRAYRLSYCLRHNIVPEPEPSWLCQYCEYIGICPNPQKYTSRAGGL